MLDQANDRLNPSAEVTKDSRLSGLESGSEAPKVYTLYKRRHLELGLYCLGAALS